MDEKLKKELENEKRRLRYQKNKEKILATNKQWRDNNKEKLVRPGHYEKYKESYKNYANKTKDKKKEYNKTNKEKKKKWDKKYQEKNKKKIAENKKVYRKINKDALKINKAKYQKERRKVDPLFKLTDNIRSMISSSIKRKGYKKTTKTYDILGCSYEEFKMHLEAQWEAWMSWENYGLYNGTENYGWDIDHIIPQSSAKDEKGVIALNHYTNLRPLCSYYNRVIKWNRIIN